MAMGEVGPTTGMGGKKRYVGWSEEVVSQDKGRREVHYYLRDLSGGRDLAVVGKERSLRHMSYAVPARFLRDLHVAAEEEGFELRWRSRREVIDWLESLVSDSAYGTSSLVDRSDGFSSYENDDADLADVPTSKGLSSGKLGHDSKDFSWLGSAWNCRKRRKHYRSFCRKGINISVHNFVYILSDEKKSLIAYVEDLYEDTRANNRVVVRWFHKVDEVGIVLPSDVNDREIFFSPCLQDFSIECIDGLAAVLSAQHFEKFQNGTKHGSWQPYLCRRQIDNDDVKPFDITQVQGYWSQEVLRTLFEPPRKVAPSLKLRLKITNSGSRSDGGHKRKNEFISEDINPSGAAATQTSKSRCLIVENSTEKHCASNGSCSGSGLLRNVLKQNLQHQLFPGCNAELLSQDSGIRGCWFRCVILKRHQDKIKVRYQDLQDADETGNLEEWVCLTRIAAPDEFGIRICGRPMVRPHPLQRSKVPCSFDVGAIVDAWWHNGWWEGIVIRRETEGQIHVYFPGEKRVALFGQGELRHSQDWVSNKWNTLKDRKDVASQVLSTKEAEHNVLTGELKLQETHPPPRLEAQEEKPQSEDKKDEGTISGNVASLENWENNALDLTKDLKFDNLKWSSRKRRRCGSKRLSDTSSGSSQEDVEEYSHCGGFVLLNSLTVDKEQCKIGGDLAFSSMPISNNLVMSI